MTTFAWPSSVIPADLSWGIAKSAFQFRSPFGASPPQTVEFPGAYWRVSLSLPDMDKRDGGFMAALFYRLAGGVDRVQVPFWPRMVPLGSLRGTPVLATQANRGDQQLSVTGTGTLFAGDMIGCGGQMFSVVDASGTAPIVVVTSNRVRATLPAGSPVIWDSPLLTCIAPGLTWDATYQPGQMNGLHVDFEEA